MIRVDFEGRERGLDTTRIMFKDAMGIQSYTGVSIGDWQDGLEFPVEKGGDGEPDKVLNPPPEWLKYVAALYWLMLRQNGEVAVIGEVDFDPFGFYAAYVQALGRRVAELRAEKAEKAAAPDPIQPGLSPPGDQLSPALSSPTATTRKPRARRPEPEAATGS